MAATGREPHHRGVYPTLEARRVPALLCASTGGPTMPHWRSLIERDSLGAWDMYGPDGKPRDVTLTIATVVGRKIKSRENPRGKGKCTITFRGACCERVKGTKDERDHVHKYLIAGATICEVIESIVGSDDISKWPGHKITLYAGTTDVGKRRGVPCVRVRPGKPAGPVQDVPNQSVDEGMRAEQDAAFGRQPGED
jgi:hypothetical protein